MGKDTTISGELVDRTGCKREFQFVLKSQSEICGSESLGRIRESRRNLNDESTSMEEGKKSSRGGFRLKGRNKRIRLSVVLETMATVSDHLPEDLVGEILSRLPITSLGSIRSTCKRWNALSKNRIFEKIPEVKNQILGFTMKGFKICSVRMDLQGIHRNNFIDLSIKHVSVLSQIKVSQVYHCYGLLLCTLKDDTSRLLVWNPYSGQRRWIQHLYDSCDGFFLGYDNSGNHKILQLLNFYSNNFYNHVMRKPIFGFKIYKFSSNSWRRDLDVTTPRKLLNAPVTLKGMTYFYGQGEVIEEGAEIKTEHFLLCFDFTSERFGPHLSLPFGCNPIDLVILSPVRDKQLAALYQSWSSSRIIEIWVTNKIDYDNVLWTKWMALDMNLLTHDFNFYDSHGNFFIDEENNIAVVLDLFYQRVLIFGQDGYFKSINVHGVPYPYHRVKDKLTLLSPVCSYVPSLVEIK